jgi:hypothetical protein
MFLLSSQNVFEYLLKIGFCHPTDLDSLQIELKPAKNFNLLISLPNGQKILVKQERRNLEGKTANEFVNEWRIQQFVQQFPELETWSCFLSEILYFDADNSIIFSNYLGQYRDLESFYAQENSFPTAIATSIGVTLAKIHGQTLDRKEYQDFFCESQDDVPHPMSQISSQLQRVGPEILGLVPADGLKFFALYQRYDSLGQAIAQAISTLTPRCLCHYDLKLNNILLRTNWEQSLTKNNDSIPSITRIIDWERCTWGDPAFDMGMIVGSYLKIWLSSLVISKDIDLQEILRLAMTPLDCLQPSLAALINAYFNDFPEILEVNPDFLQRVVQFSGIALIQEIQSMLQYYKTFGNTGICMLQVAKSLLCRPSESINTVFASSESALTRLSRYSA